MLSVSPEDAPDKPECLQQLFEKGDCIGLQIDGPGDLLGELGETATGESDGYTLLAPLGIMRVPNKLAGRNVIGRIDMVENRFVGMKSRSIYETPGGTILLHAHRQMESLTMDREVMLMRDSLIPKYAQWVYNGFWFAPERDALQAMINDTQKNVSGEVRVKLYKGNVMAAGVKSRLSLHDEDVASMEGGTEHAYNQDDATDSIRLNALRLKNEASRRER